MTPPAPQPQRPGPLRLLVWAGVGLVGVSIALLARIPPPQAPALLQQVAVVHDALITGRARLTGGPPATPRLEGSLVSQLDGVRVDSWLYATEAGAVSAHRTPGPVVWPRNAMDFRLDDLPAQLFELGDLSVLGWTEDGSWLLVGAAPAADLRPVARWLRTRPTPGAPDGVTPRRTPDPPSDGAPTGR